MESSTRTRPQRGEHLELEITDLAFGGAGVARMDGYVLFVQGVVPGDRVTAEVTKSRKSFGEARALDVPEPGPDRIDAVADHPGAPWQVLRYERQLEVKHAQVDDALRRLGKLEGFELEPIIPAEQQWRYRNKLEYSFGTDDEGGLVCGFHAPGRWDDIVDMADCKLVSERVNALREQVVTFSRQHGLPAWDR